MTYLSHAKKNMPLLYLVSVKKLYNNVIFTSHKPYLMVIYGFVWSLQHCSSFISLVQSSQSVKKYPLEAA